RACPTAASQSSLPGSAETVSARHGETTQQGRLKSRKSRENWTAFNWLSIRSKKQAQDPLGYLRKNWRSEITRSARSYPLLCLPEVRRRCGRSDSTSRNATSHGGSGPDDRGRDHGHDHFRDRRVSPRARRSSQPVAWASRAAG